MPLEIAKDQNLGNALSTQEPSAQPPLRGSFTAEEVVTLHKWLPGFQQTKRSNGKKFVGFWEPFEKDYFGEHPLRDLTEEEIAAGLVPGQRLNRLRKVSKGLALAC